MIPNPETQGHDVRRVDFSSAGYRIRALYYVPADPGEGGGYQVSGARPWPAVLICHGALGNKEQFQALADHLLWAGFAVLIPDMRGHGESGGDRYHVVMDDWMTDLRAAVAWLAAQPEIDASRVGGFGFSSGGTAMLELACEQDHGFASLVTLGATVRSILSSFETRVFRGLGALGRLKRRWLGSDLHLPLYPLIRSKPVAHNPAVNTAVLDDPYLRAGYWRYPIPGALDSLIVNTLKRVGNIRIPVCILHGQDDRIDAPDSAHALFRCLGGEKSLHLIPRSGHMGHLDQSREIVFALAGEWFSKRLS